MHLHRRTRRAFLRWRFTRGASDSGKPCPAGRPTLPGPLRGGGGTPGGYCARPRTSGLWLGRVDPIKDLHTLIRAAAVMRDRKPGVVVRLFGSAGPGQKDYLTSCQRLVESLQLNGVVQFEGAVDSPPLAFHAGHISALSSISEGFPYAVLESMACGVPVVATDVGGVREAIGDAGRCVQARDHRALGLACLELLDNTQLRRTMGRLGRSRVERLFDLDTMLRIHDEVYAHVGQRRGRDLTAPASRATVIDIRESTSTKAVR